MSWWIARLGMIALCGMGVGAAVVAPRDREPVAGAVPAAAATGAPLPAAQPPDSMMAFVVAHDLFSPRRRASTVPYDPAWASVAVRQEQRVTAGRPVLKLTGVIWGRKPLAVIEGLPGLAEPRVVAVGEEYGELTVRTIALDSVTIAGADTTWTLTVDPRS